MVDAWRDHSADSHWPHRLHWETSNRNNHHKLIAHLARPPFSFLCNWISVLIIWSARCQQHHAGSAPNSQVPVPLVNQVSREPDWGKHLRRREFFSEPGSSELLASLRCRTHWNSTENAYLSFRRLRICVFISLLYIWASTESNSWKVWFGCALGSEFTKKTVKLFDCLRWHWFLF